VTVRRRSSNTTCHVACDSFRDGGRVHTSTHTRTHTRYLGTMSPTRIVIMRVLTVIIPPPVDNFSETIHCGKLQAFVIIIIVIIIIIMTIFTTTVCVVIIILLLLCASLADGVIYCFRHIFFRQYCYIILYCTQFVFCRRPRTDTKTTKTPLQRFIIIMFSCFFLSLLAAPRRVPQPSTVYIR